MTQTTNRVSQDLKSIVREVLAEEKQEQTELISIMEMLTKLNQKVDALAAK